MFIIKFMSGLVENIGGDDEEGAFDPHKHRKIANPTTYSDTMIHFLKGSIGAGILAMPDAVRRVGVINSVIGLCTLGFFAAHCIQLLIRAQYKLCKRWKRGYMAYPKSMRLAVQDGPPCMRWTAGFYYYFVDTVLILWQLGICCIYFIFIAENVKKVCDFYGFVASLPMHLCCLLLPTIIINLVKDLKMMTPMSSISNIVTMFGLILVFFYLIEDDLQLKPEMNELKGVGEIPIFIGTSLFALEAVGVVLALEYNMDNPKRFVGLCGLFNMGMIIIISLYLLLGVFGYLKYGEEVKASLTLNLPAAEKKAQAASLIFAFAIFLSFPLQNFVAYNILWRRIKKRLEGRNQCVPDYFMRVLLVVIPWVLAVLLPKLGPFISLFGALCLSLLAMVFPGIIDLCLYYSEPNGYGYLKYRLIRSIFIIIIGTGCMVSGVFSSILEITQGE